MVYHECYGACFIIYHDTNSLDALIVRPIVLQPHLFVVTGVSIHQLRQYPNAVWQHPTVHGNRVRVVLAVAAMHA